MPGQQLDSNTLNISPSTSKHISKAKTEPNQNQNLPPKQKKKSAFKAEIKQKS